MDVDADEALASRPRRSAAEPDRITRFASPNRFDSLDAPVSFLDRRSSPGVSSRGSVHANLDAITRRAVPERCISSDLLIGSRTGQVYRTSHSASTKPTRSSTTQSLPMRAKLARQDHLEGGRTVPRQNLVRESTRLSDLTASVQRLLADREAERQAISRQQFELQIGARSGSEGNVRDPIRPCLASKQFSSPPGHHDRDRGDSWSSSEKFQPERISQELVNDFFSSPLKDTPGYGDFGIAVAMSNDEILPLDVSIPRASSSCGSQPPGSPRTLPSPGSVALEDSHPEISKLEARVRTRNLIHTEVATKAKRLSLTTRARNTLSLELPEPVREEGADERAAEAGEAGEPEDPEFVKQLDDLAGRMGLVQRRPSALERGRREPVPKLADESYREATASRQLSAPEQEKKEKKHRRTLSSGSGLLASFWRHFSPRLSRRGRRSLAGEGRQKARSDSGADSKTAGSELGSGDWDSVSSSPQKGRPGSASSCPSPDNVFSTHASSEWVQPSVNRKVMASIEKDRIRDPYQSFKTRALQQQQQQQQSSADSPVISRPSQLSINSSTPSSTGSAPRIHGSKTSGESSESSAPQTSPGPRYINVSRAAYGYGVAYRAGTRDPALKAPQSVSEGLSHALEHHEPAERERLSCPPAFDSVDALPDGRGAEEPDEVPKREEEQREEEPKEEEKREEKMAQLTNGHSNGSSCETLKSEDSAKPRENGTEKSEAEKAPEMRSSRPATLPTEPGASPVSRRRSKTMPRGGTPSSPLNRSFDAQTAARSSLIMLAVGHSSPRPKSVSVSATESEGLEEECCPDSEDEPGSTGRDGRHFLRVVDAAERDIRAAIAATEAELQLHDGVMAEEVSGMLRTAVGKATLLVSDKFAQFRGLCEENLGGKGATPYATRSSDLEGFWEMVELQVSDVRRMFSEIQRLRQNGWQALEAPRPVRTAPIPPSEPRKATRRPATAPARPRKAAGPTAASVAREEARKRLLAAKREAMARKKAAESGGTDGADVIFIS